MIVTNLVCDVFLLSLEIAKSAGHVNRKRKCILNYFMAEAVIR